MKLYQNLNVTGSLTLTGSLNTVGTITATPPDSVLYIILCIGCPIGKWKQKL